jgi:MoaA/NifB/PqqE/SkfB family radical SAM enzyme
MNIHNIRLGFATNSSSSHSLVFLNDIDDQGLDHYDFGWNHFTAASEKTKEVYVALHIISAIRRTIVDEDTSYLVVKGLMGEEIAKCAEDGYIDHQSIYMLPLNWNGNGPDYEFIEDFRKFMARKDLVILGGNDNGMDGHPLDKGRAFTFPIPQDEYSNEWVAKKDPQGFWTLFNRGSGGKIRMSFDELKRVAPKYSTTPELIDIKITDFCEKGCDYCYQGSSPFGKHADWGKRCSYRPCEHKSMHPFLSALKELKVFEVAIGGGEPTDHPHFVKILEEFREYGIVPNFSTGSLKWLKENSEKRERILKAMGNFAYSIKDWHEIEELVSFANVYRLKRPTIHYVMGTSYYFESVLKEARKFRQNVVLLGYKNVGKGLRYKPHDYSDWVKTIVKLREEDKCPDISIDTPLANQFADELKEAGVNDLFVHRTEGAFSMYIDLVEGKMGPSSFCDKSELVDIDIYKYKLADSIKKHYPFVEGEK